MAAVRQDYCSLSDLESNCSAIAASSPTTAQAATAITSATDLMWALLGRQFASYTEKIRPDIQEASHFIDLDRFPVNSIDEVLIDGEVVPSDQYYLHDQRYLMRVDGTSWPTFQKLHLDDTEEGTFSVALTWGRPAPDSVRQATRRLACELLTLDNGGKSSLNDRVRNVVRNGITMEVVSADDLLESGRTGIYEVDLVLAVYNRDGHTALPFVVNPDDKLTAPGPIVGGIPATATGVGLSESDVWAIVAQAISASGGGASGTVIISGGGASTLPELDDVAAIESTTLDTETSTSFTMEMLDSVPYMETLLSGPPDRNWSDIGIVSTGSTAAVSASGTVGGSLRIDWPSDARSEGDSVTDLEIRLTVTLQSGAGSLYLVPVLNDVELARHVMFTSVDVVQSHVSVTRGEASGLPYVAFQEGVDFTPGDSFDVAFTLDGMRLRQHVDDLHVEVFTSSTPGKSWSLTWTGYTADGFTSDVIDQGNDLLKSALKTDVRQIVQEEVYNAPKTGTRIKALDNSGDLRQEELFQIIGATESPAEWHGLFLRDNGGEVALTTAKMWSPLVTTTAVSWTPGASGQLTHSGNFIGGGHSDALFQGYLAVTSDEVYPGKVVTCRVRVIAAGSTVERTVEVPVAGRWALRAPWLINVSLDRAVGEVYIPWEITLEWDSFAPELTDPEMVFQGYMLTEKVW